MDKKIYETPKALTLDLMSEPLLGNLNSKESEDPENTRRKMPTDNTAGNKSPIPSGANKTNALNTTKKLCQAMKA